MTLNIGLGHGQKQEDEIEVPDNWYSLSSDEQDEILGPFWEDWAGNYIDGGIREVD